MATSGASGSADPTLTWTGRRGRDCPSWPPRRNGPIRHLFTANLKKVWKDGAFEGGYRRFHEMIVGRMPPTHTGLMKC
jgi:hypothetical protein